MPERTSWYPSRQGRWRYEVRAVTAAPQATVWPLVGEAARWRDWSFMTRTYLLREGSPDPDGVGALRRFAVRVPPGRGHASARSAR